MTDMREKKKKTFWSDLGKKKFYTSTTRFYWLRIKREKEKKLFTSFVSGLRTYWLTLVVTKLAGVWATGERRRKRKYYWHHPFIDCLILGLLIYTHVRTCAFLYNWYKKFLLTTTEFDSFSIYKCHLQLVLEDNLFVLLLNWSNLSWTTCPK